MYTPFYDSYAGWKREDLGEMCNFGQISSGQQLSFFNGGYGQHMYHPMLVFERHTGCLLAARLRPGNASSHARIVPMLLRLVPRLQAAFPEVKIKLRGDAGFAFPLLYEFCEFFALQYAIGIPANCVFQQRPGKNS